MSWANCGTDSEGRPIGYAHAATCDAPCCSAEIDRGLSYACGGMHGADDVSCEKYFCPDHLTNIVRKHNGDEVQVCDECRAFLLLTLEWKEDKREGILVPKS